MRCFFVFVFIFFLHLIVLFILIVLKLCLETDYMCCLRQFLYPSEEDSYKLIRFLVERLSELSEDIGKSGPKGVNDRREVKEDSFESNLEDHKTGDQGSDLSYDKVGAKLDKLTFNGKLPELTNTNDEDASFSTSADAHLIPQKMDENGVDHVSSSSTGEFNKGGQNSVLSRKHSTEKLQNQEKLLMEEVTAKASELKHLEEELELLKEAADMAFDFHHPVEFYLAKLNEQVDVRKHHLVELKSEW